MAKWFKKVAENINFKHQKDEREWRKLSSEAENKPSSNGEK